MQSFERFKSSFLDLDGRLCLEVDNIRDESLQDEGLGQVVGEDVLMELVVKNFALLSGSLHISKLPAANCVSDSALSGSLENVDGTIGDSNPRLYHDLVDHSWVADHLEFALTIDLCEAGEHC